MKKFVKEYLPYVLILLVIILLRIYVVTPVTVDGNSMNDTLYPNDLMLLFKVGNIERYDIVVANHDNKKLIKRVIGMPNDKIKCVSGILYINNEEDTSGYGYGENIDFPEYTLKDDEYFLIADNRSDSFDSRYFGPVKKEDIVGKANFIIFPFNRFGSVD